MFFRKKGVEGWGAAKEYRDCRRGGGDGEGGGLWIFFPGPLLDPRTRPACIKRILYSTTSTYSIFSSRVFVYILKHRLFLYRKYQNTKTIFLRFFSSYKFTVKHRVKTSHKIIIMMHYHYNIMIVRTKQNDNFSPLISALQTYND